MSEQSKEESVALHTCCGPCASACVPRLLECADKVVMVFANSNIDSAEEFERLGVGAMRKAAREGDEQNGSFMCGQIAGLVKKEQPAAEIIREMFTEAEALLKGAAQWVK